MAKSGEKKLKEKQISKIDNKSISGDLIGDIRSLIETARHNVAVTVNAGLTLLYWQIGNRIRQDILKEKRAEYGEEIISTLSIHLVKEFGNGFSRPNLFRMVRFAEVFPEGKIVSTLSRQLSWSHFVEIIPLNLHFARKKIKFQDLYYLSSTMRITCLYYYK